MGADQNIDWSGERAAVLAATLEWWRDAGVDVLVEDAPRDWLADAPDAFAPLLPALSVRDAPAAAPGLTGTLPDTLDAFLEWRAGGEAPEAQWRGRSVAPSGPLDADLMILVDCPERDEGDRLIGGAAGRLFDRMLAAIGRTRDDVRIASVCSARPPTGRMAPAIAGRLGEIARHHVALAGPKTLLVMGDAANRAMLSTNSEEGRGRLHSLNHKSGKQTVAVATYHPRTLIEHPRLKAGAWRDLQMLMGELQS